MNGLYLLPLSHCGCFSCVTLIMVPVVYQLSCSVKKHDVFWVLAIYVCLNNFVNWSFCDAICLKNQAACLELGMSNRPVAGDFTISSLSWFLLVERWGWQTPSFLEKYIITKISRCNFRRNLTEQSFKNQEVSFVFT